MNDTIATDPKPTKAPAKTEPRPECEPVKQISWKQPTTMPGTPSLDAIRTDARIKIDWFQSRRHFRITFKETPDAPVKVRWAHETCALSWDPV